MIMKQQNLTKQDLEIAEKVITNSPQLKQGGYSKIALLDEVERYSDIYQFSFQFWGEGNNNFFIEKDGVELSSGGGFTTIEQCIATVLNYLYRVNRTPHSKRVKLCSF